MKPNYGYTAILVFFMVLSGLLPVYAHIGGQITGFAAAPLAEDPDSFDDIPRGYGNTRNDDLFGGIEGEIWFDKLGIGMRHAGRFFVTPVEVLDEGTDEVVTRNRDAWWYDGKGDIFASYHLFGGGSFIDPYIRYGAGIATRHLVSRSFGYDPDRDVWTTEEALSDDDDTDDRDDYDRLESAGIYQYVGAGAQLNLAGLVLGAGVNYNIIFQRIDSGSFDVDTFPANRVEARIYGGVAF
jgi:hypothetical protein